MIHWWQRWDCDSINVGHGVRIKLDNSGDMENNIHGGRNVVML